MIVLRSTFVDFWMGDQRCSSMDDFVGNHFKDWSGYIGKNSLKIDAAAAIAKIGT